jgi:hypothetical protein
MQACREPCRHACKQVRVTWLLDEGALTMLLTCPDRVSQLWSCLAGVPTLIHKYPAAAAEVSSRSCANFHMLLSRFALPPLLWPRYCSACALTLQRKCPVNAAQDIRRRSASALALLPTCLDAAPQVIRRRFLGAQTLQVTFLEAAKHVPWQCKAGVLAVHLSCSDTLWHLLFNCRPRGKTLMCMCPVDAAAVPDAPAQIPRYCFAVSLTLHSRVLRQCCVRTMTAVNVTWLC